MNSYLSIITKFYDPQSDLFSLLVSHSESVMTLALDLARKNNLDVDYSLVASGAMLHDIGIIGTNAPTILCNGKADYMRHGLIGAEMLRKFGMEAEARICERHIGCGLTASEISAQGLPLPETDFLPKTLEEKLICYADNFFSKSTPKLIARRYDEVRAKMQKYGQDTVRRFDEMTTLFGNPDNFLA